MNKFDFFVPLMFESEYRFIEKFLNKKDIFLEWGSGDGTIYFSGLVKKMISIEHDIDYYNILKKNIDAYNIKNIELYHVPGKMVKDPVLNRYEAFEKYINFPIKNKFKFDKVLIDGRARKHCAIAISKYLNDDNIVFIHDFNHNDVEGFIDENYFDEILKNFEIIERNIQGRGIIALKRK